MIDPGSMLLTPTDVDVPVPLRDPRYSGAPDSTYAQMNSLSDEEPNVTVNDVSPPVDSFEYRREPIV
ncbi:hypothetical protein ABT352_33360 [Streptosporangium sp. NPDC000563]|uniref:hypothetical protein n=1 Tax=Streptosporangium sp. NPDC000563 TaxID=3154366 RepID=UPI00332CD25A